MKPGREHVGVGVGCVIVENGNLLMVQRAGAHGAGTWSVPGGWIEHGESAWTAAAREVEEETGMLVYGAYESSMPLGWSASMTDGVHSVTLWIRCIRLPGSPDPWVAEPEKCPKVEWVLLADVASLPLFDGISAHWAHLLANL